MKSFCILTVLFMIAALSIADTLSAEEWRNEVIATIQNDRTRILERRNGVQELSEIKKNKETQRRLLSETKNMHDLAARQTDLEIKSKELERDKIKNKIEIMINNPDISSPQLLESIQQSNRAVQNEMSTLKIIYDKQFAFLENINRQLTNLDDEITRVESDIEKLRLEIREIAENFIEIVTVHEKCIISHDISPNECKQKAMQNAERRAVEVGGQSLIRSITEMVNYQITRDEITREINARIIKKDFRIIFEKDDGDFGSYSVELSAAVKNISNSKTTAPKPSAATESPLEQTSPKISYNAAYEIWESTKTVSQVVGWSFAFIALLEFGIISSTQSELDDCTSGLYDPCDEYFNSPAERDSEISRLENKLSTAKKAQSQSIVISAVSFIIYLAIKDNPPRMQDYSAHSLRWGAYISMSSDQVTFSISTRF